jgi:hypothetical protein
MAFYFENTKHIPFHIEKFQKNKFCASFPLYFLLVFLVNANLVSKQSIISSHIGASTLHHSPCACHIQPPPLATILIKVAGARTLHLPKPPTLDSYLVFRFHREGCTSCANGAYD